LLIKLGSLLSDIIPAEVYQLHREPPTWEWQEEPEEFRYIVSEPATANPLVALNLSLSASIDSQRIRKSFQGQNYSEWQMTIENPNNDFLKSYSQLQLFRKEFRRLLDTIKLKHGQNASIHIFPAVPVSIAVEIGRVRQPKADLPFVIYDQNNKTGGFIHTLNIGESEND
jgi:flagellar motor switch/type III secretory pathway protein FliN